MKNVKFFLLLLLFAVSQSQTAFSQTDGLCYEMRIYTCQKGKLNDLNKRFRNHTMKLFEKHGMTNIAYFTPIDNPEEKLYYVMSYPNRAARDSSWARFIRDTAWHRVRDESEVNGKLLTKIESIFMKTTDFSPNNMKTDCDARMWEFRIYTTTPNNLDNLLARFRNFTVKRFEKYGMVNKMYWTDTEAANSDKMLYYFLAHKSEAAGKESFADFRKDEDWIKVRKESEVKGGGSLTTKVESIYMVPTDYSPIK